MQNVFTRWWLPILFLGLWWWPISLYSRAESLKQGSFQQALLPTATPTPVRISQELYSAKITNMDVLFKQHILYKQPKSTNEYRVILIGDSSTSAEYLPFRETMTGILNNSKLKTCDNRNVRVYNMGMIAPTLVKDLVFIDKSVEYKPDLVLWFITLHTFRPESLLLSDTFLPYNRTYIENLNQRYSLGLNTSTMQESTQTTEEAWSIVLAAKDPPHSDTYTPPSNDLLESITYSPSLPPPQITAQKLPFKLFYTGLKILSKTKVLVINEPIFIATGANSNLRYNKYYPRWIYDQYRTIMSKQSTTNGWAYLDLWNLIPAANFTVTALHPDPTGESLKAQAMAPIIQQYPCKN